VGLYFSFTYNLASGATIVLVSTVLFLLAFGFSPKQGILWRSLKARRKKHALS
jgi:iron/zinc/copper transport system permease protein